MIRGPFTASIFHTFIDQIGNIFPKEWTLEFENNILGFEKVNLGHYIQSIQPLKKEMIFWGKSFIPNWINEFLRYEIDVIQMNVQNNMNTPKNKVCVELISPIHKLSDSITNLFKEITTLFQSSCSDFNDGKPFDVTHKFSVLGSSFEYPINIDSLPIMKWLTDDCQKGIVHFYPFHPIIETTMHLHSSRNRPWNKIMHPTWRSFIRIAGENNIDTIGNAKMNILPQFNYIWHAQLFILNNSIDQMFNDAVGVSLLDIYKRKFTQIPNDINYGICVFKKKNFTESLKGFDIWLVISCYNNYMISKLWIQSIKNQIDPNNWELVTIK
jgi:hypothetical protein